MLKSFQIVFLTVFINLLSAVEWYEEGEGGWALDNGNLVPANAALFLNTNSVTYAIEQDGVTIGDDGDLLGAFYDGELRGIIDGTSPPFGPYSSSSLFLIYMYSNTSGSEEMNFKFYDASSGSVSDLNETYIFIADAPLGTAVAPEILTLAASDDSGDDDCAGYSDTAGWNQEGVGGYAYSNGNLVPENASNFQNTNSVTYRLADESGIAVGEEGDLLGAFYDGELRGIANPFSVPIGPYAGENFYLLYMYSNNSGTEDFTFKFYDHSTGLTYDLPETYTFVADDPQGGLFSPWSLLVSLCACDDVDEDGICDDEDDCVGSLDCAGECNGTAELDDCGVCDGGNASQDCLGVCDGTAVVDDCGVCNGGNASQDCAGVCNGSAVEDCDGVCEGDAEQDCAGICNGTSIYNQNGCIPQEFDYNTSLNQAGYFFYSVTIDGNEVSSDDWVGAFNGDLCVGARQWDVSQCGGGVCEVPVMGNDGSEFTQGYMTAGSIPTFKVFDASSGEIYDATASEDFPWFNLGLNIIDNLNVFPDCNGNLGGEIGNEDDDCACDDVDQCPGQDDCLDSDGDVAPDCLDICPYDAENDIDGDGLCCGFSNNLNSSTYLEFDGIDDHINLGSASEIQFGTGDFTASAKINISDFHSGAIFSNYRCYGQYPLWQLRAESQDGGPLVLMYELRPWGHTVWGTTDVGDGYWHDIAIVKEGSNYKIYLDGNIEVEQTIDSDPVTEGQDLYIGVQHSDCGEDGYFYKGLMDDAILWNLALNSEEILLLNSGSIVRENNIVRHFDFEDGAGNLLIDKSVYGNDGIIYGNPIWQEETGVLEDTCCYDSLNDIDEDGLCGCTVEDCSVVDPLDECPYDFDNDSDNDGVCGDVDVCQGFDDNLDENENSYPDDCEGCMDIEAENYDPINIFDDESCYYRYSLDYHEGANLESFYVFPDTTNYFYSYMTQDLVESIFNENISGILGDESSVVFIDGNMYGSLIDLDRASGYWIKLLNSQSADLVGYRTYSDIEYSLNAGNNLISFPYYDNVLIEDALPEQLDGIITAIFSEGATAINENGEWIGSLTSLSGFNGYWLRSNEDISFTFDIEEDVFFRNIVTSPKEELYGYEFIQSSSQAAYFVRNIPEASIGDWIIAFNGDEVVGSRKWNGSMIDVPVMGNDNELYSINYISEGESPTLMLYKSSTGELQQLHGSIPGFINHEIFIIDELATTQLFLPSEVVLNNAYPNPFNPVTNVSFNLPYSMHVEINILDVQGRIVDTVSSGGFNEGFNEITINGNNLSSGLYFVQLIAGLDIKYTKILLLK